MDIRNLNIEYGDTVILTYDERADLDVINSNYGAVKKVLHEAYGCIVVPNREDLIKNIVVVKSDGEVLPFR